jgi:hypothetical protein
LPTSVASASWKTGWVSFFLMTASENMLL